MLTTLDRLTFGRKVPDGSLITDADWSAFETSTIAAAFPAGYTVIHAEGAWRDASTGQPVREPSVIVEIAHGGSPEELAAVRAIATAYKVIFRQDAVMRVTSAISVDFI